MFSHIFVGVTDFERALAFHSAVMSALGKERRFHDPDKPWAGWHDDGQKRPFFVICRPFDGAPHDPGNGQMVAFDAPDRRTVDKVYALALSLGGMSEGAPGVRAHYHANYYGAYYRDPDGNKFCVVCHAADPEITPAP